MSGRETYLYTQCVAQQPAGAAQLAPQLYTLYFRLRRPGLSARVVRAGTSKAVRFSLSVSVVIKGVPLTVELCVSVSRGARARVGLRCGTVCGEAQSGKEAAPDCWEGNVEGKRTASGIYARYPPCPASPVAHSHDNGVSRSP